jgi:hypothetical protein
MRLRWFTINDSNGHNSGYNVLWTENGFYSWVNADVGENQRIIIDFYPRPPLTRHVVRLGSFIGTDRIMEAENAVEFFDQRLSRSAKEFVYDGLTSIIRNQIQGS